MALRSPAECIWGFREGGVLEQDGSRDQPGERAKKINNKQDTRMGKDDFRKIILH